MPENCEATITLTGDLHARPAGALSVAAAGFSSAVQLAVAGKEVDAKSVLSVMQLGASSGQEVTVRAVGADVSIDGDTVTVAPSTPLSGDVPLSFSGLNRIPVLLIGPLLHLTGEADRPPVRPGVTVADYLTGAFAAEAALAALYRRDAGRGREGDGGAEGRQGAVIDASLYGSVLRIPRRFWRTSQERLRQHVYESEQRLLP